MQPPRWAEEEQSQRVVLRSLAAEFGGVYFSLISFGVRSVISGGNLPLYTTMLAASFSGRHSAAALFVLWWKHIFTWLLQGISENY